MADEKRTYLSILQHKYYYNENIIINVPLVRQIAGDTYNQSAESLSEFWKIVNLFTQTPSDMISELDSIGIDFEQLTDYTLFIYMYTIYSLGIKQSNTDVNTIPQVLFEGLNLWSLESKVIENGEVNNIVLVDKDGKVIFDEKIFNDISLIIAEMVGYTKTKKIKFGNAYAKKKTIEIDYKKKQRAKEKKEHSSYLDGIILRLVCNANFPYTFETVGDITLHQLIYSLKQVDKDIQVTDLYQSRLVGVDLNQFPKEELSRFVL